MHDFDLIGGQILGWKAHRLAAEDGILLELILLESHIGSPKELFVGSGSLHVSPEAFLESFG